MELEIHLKPFVHKKEVNWVVLYSYFSAWGANVWGANYWDRIFLFQERTERQGEKETVFASSRGETLCPLEDFLDECIKTD